MSFVTTAFLWGLAAISVPLLIHLFNKRRRITVQWGAMQFLMANEKTRRRSIFRVSDVIPLILRALAIAALAVAFARPLVSGGLARNTAPRDVVVVIDNSLSTSRTLDNGETVLDSIKNHALDIIADLGPRDRPFVLATCPTPRWLTPQPDTTAGTLASLARAAVRDLSPSNAAPDFASSLSAALTNPPSHDPAPRQLVLLTEPQASGWSPDQLARWTAVRDLTQSLAGSSVETRHPAAQSTPHINLAVTSIETADPVVEAGAEIELHATITNHSPSTSPQTTLHWTVGPAASGLVTVPPLNPGASITIPHTATLTSPATYPVTATLGITDPITADNATSTVVEALDRVPVLFVTDDKGDGSRPPSASISEDPAFFLAALGRSRSDNPDTPRWRSVFTPTVLTLTEFLETDLTPFAAIVLSDPGTLDSAHAAALRRFVSAGGGLWIAPGPGTDIRAFNRHLHAAGTGPSPVLLDPATDAADTPPGDKTFRLAVPTPPHDAVALLSDPRLLDLPDARLTRAYHFRRPLPEDASPLLTIPGSTSPNFAVARTFDAGRVIVQAAPLGTAWGNLPALSVYVPLVNEWLWHLTEPAMTPRNLSPGTPFFDPHLAGAITHGKSLTLTFPDGSSIPATVTTTNGRPSLRITATAEPGLYTLTYPPTSGTSAPNHFTVSRDPAESDPTPLTPEQVATIADLSLITFPGTRPADATPDTPSIPQETESEPTPLREPAWGWFFLLLLVFLALESIVSLVTRHRRARASRTILTHA